MKFFLDTANLEELKTGASWGIVDGVTTKPTLIAKERPSTTQVLAASLRSPTHVIDAALAGAHIRTMPFQVMDILFNHPLTDKGLDQLLKDCAKAFQEVPVAG